MENVRALVVPPRGRSLFVLLFLASCTGGEELLLPGDGVPAAITVVEGDRQSGVVGEPLADPLIVQVTDSRERPVEGVTVGFAVTSGGSGAEIAPASTTTNSDGLADARVVLGTKIGTQTGEARVVVPEGRQPVRTTFSATALSESANRMAAVAGQDQTGHVGMPLDDRLVIEVTDGFGNPVAGVPISWAVEGGGSVSAEIVDTDDDGRARVERTLGPAVGRQATIASSEGLAGSPVTFVHTAVAGNASRLIVVSGDDQTAAAGSLLPAELVVRLVDADGNGVPNTAVTWVVATGGGSVTPENTTTDDEGRTTAQWTLGDAVGEQRLDAVVSGVGVATFRATATAGAPASLFIRTQPSPSARNGVVLDRQPVIQVRDARGNDVSAAGIPVSVAVEGGGELGGTIQVNTDAAGRATFTNLSISGSPGPRTLVFTAPGYASVTSSGIDLAAVGTTTTITNDSPDPSAAGSTFTVGFRVGSPGATPTGSVTVTVSGGTPSCTAPLSGGAGGCSLTLNIVGDRTLTATYSGSAGFSPSSDTEPHRVESTVPTPIATTTTITGDSPDPTVSGTTFTVSFRVASGGGTPTGSVRVTVSGGTPDCTGTLSGGIGSCNLTLNTVGDRILTATYSGAPGFLGSSDREPHRVNAPAPSNEPPDADFNWHCEDLTCHFTDSSEDDDGAITNRNWNFGDGSTSNEVNPSHTYATEGNYTVILTVTDNGGLSDDARDVVDPKAPPPQVLGIGRQPSSSATVGEPLGRQPLVRLQAGGNDIARSGVVVTASIASGSGSLGGTTTATTDGDGRAEFTNLSINGATGPHRLRFTADGFAEVISDQISVEKASSSTALAHTPNPSEAGTPFTVSVSVTSGGSTPVGQVNVAASGAGSVRECTITLSGGTGNCQLNLDADGTLTATYTGDDLHNPSEDQKSHKVNPAPPPPPAATTTAITAVDGVTAPPTASVDGVPITVSFTVTSDGGVPDGNVQVSDGAGAGCTETVATGSCSFLPSSTGPRTITAAYQGNSSFAPSTSGGWAHSVDPPPGP
jgi:PKD repeat protein